MAKYMNQTSKITESPSLGIKQIFEEGQLNKNDRAKFRDYNLFVQGDNKKPS